MVVAALEHLREEALRAAASARERRVEEDEPGALRDLGLCMTGQNSHGLRCTAIPPDENERLSTSFPRVPGAFPQRWQQSTQVFQIGDSLREARTRRGLSPADVHKAIRIRERYLTALEEERWDMLPGEAYTKGFLKTYAEFLGLHGHLYIDEYNARVVRHDEEPASLVPHPTVQRRRVRQGGVLVTLAAILVLGAAVAGLAAWRLGGSSTPPKAAAQVPPSGGGSVAAPAVSAPPAKTTPAKKAAVLPKPSFASISAVRGRCWLLVRAGGPQGAVLYEGILQQGQAKRFRVGTRLWVRMGRPDVLDVTVAGKAVTGLPASPANVVLKS